MSEDYLARCFGGAEIFGDDFGEEQVAAWYRDEERAYLQLYADDPGYEYEYEAVNLRHGFRHLRPGRFERVLGLGSAYGDELAPIAGRCGSLVIVESADEYARRPALDVPTRWVKAVPSGDLPLPEGTFDLVVCFGVLHHIPTVSRSLREIARVLRPGGQVLIREPTISMGDWTGPRPGLTPRERGIPPRLLRDACAAAGLRVRRETPCFFPGTSWLGRKLGVDVYNRPAMVVLDELACRALAFNRVYHAVRPWQKFRPTSRFLVCEG